MKSIILLIASLSWLLFGFFSLSPAEDNLKNEIESVSPESAKDLINEMLKFDAENRLKDGEIVILNLWATWCGPCIQEVPELNELVEDYQGKGVRFLAFSKEEINIYDKFLTTRPDFAFHYELTFGNVDVVNYIQSLDQKFNGNAVPMHVLINADGSIDQVLMGASPIYSKMMRDFLDRQLSAKSNDKLISIQ